MTHVEGQAVGLVGHGEAGQLSQSDLVGDGLVHSAQDEGLPGGGQEGHDLWGDGGERPAERTRPEGSGECQAGGV